MFVSFRHKLVDLFLARTLTLMLICDQVCLKVRRSPAVLSFAYSLLIAFVWRSQYYYKSREVRGIQYHMTNQSVLSWPSGAFHIPAVEQNGSPL